MTITVETKFQCGDAVYIQQQSPKMVTITGPHRVMRIVVTQEKGDSPKITYAVDITGEPVLYTEDQILALEEVLEDTKDHLEVDP